MKRFDVTIEVDGKPPYPVSYQTEANKVSAGVARAIREFEKGKGKGKRNTTMKIWVVWGEVTKK